MVSEALHEAEVGSKEDSLRETLVRWFLQNPSPAPLPNDPQPLSPKAYAALRVYAEATCLGHPWGLCRWNRVSHQQEELYCRAGGSLENWAGSWSVCPMRTEARTP